MIELDLHSVAMRVIRALEELNVSYQVGGSLASSAMGLPRASLDADLVAELREEHAEGLIDKLGSDFYASANMIREAVRHRSSFNVLHITSAYKVDVFVLKNRAFDRQAFDRTVQRRWPAEPHREVNFCTAEDIILYKLEWFRIGDEVSERQWHDVVGVIQVQGDRLDRQYLEKWAAQLNVADLLQRALEEGAA